MLQLQQLLYMSCGARFSSSLRGWYSMMTALICNDSRSQLGNQNWPGAKERADFIGDVQCQVVSGSWACLAGLVESKESLKTCILHWRYKERFKWMKVLKIVNVGTTSQEWKKSRMNTNVRFHDTSSEVRTSATNRIMKYITLARNNPPRSESICRPCSQTLEAQRWKRRSFNPVV